MSSTEWALLVLPNEVITDIYKELDVSAFFSARQTCRRMYAISKQPSIWMALFIRQTEGCPSGLTRMLDDCTEDVLEGYVSNYASSQARWIAGNPHPIVRNWDVSKFNVIRPTGQNFENILLPGGHWMLTRTTSTNGRCTVHAHDLDDRVPTTYRILSIPQTFIPHVRFQRMATIPGEVPEVANVDAPRGCFYFALLGMSRTFGLLFPQPEIPFISIYGFRPDNPASVVSLFSLRGTRVPPGCMAFRIFQGVFLLEFIRKDTLLITNWYSLLYAKYITLPLRFRDQFLPGTVRLLNAGRILFTVHISPRGVGVQVHIHKLPQYHDGDVIWDLTSNGPQPHVHQLVPNWIIDVPDSSGFDFYSDNFNLSEPHRLHGRPSTRLALRVANMIYGVIVPDDSKLSPSIEVVSIMHGLGSVQSGLIAMGIDKLFVSQGDSIPDSFVSFPWPATGRVRKESESRPLAREWQGPAATWDEPSLPGIIVVPNRVSFMDNVSGRVVTCFKLRTTLFGDHPDRIFEGLEDQSKDKNVHPNVTWSILDVAAQEYLFYDPEE